MPSVTDEARLSDLSVVNLDDLAVKSDAEVEEIDRQVADSPYFNRDLAPAGPSRRTWSTWNIAAMWIGMSVVITTYTLASGLMASGMKWWQALLTITLGNLIVLIPMVLNAHAGVRYGIPFPVFVRASFGIRGANIAAMARAKCRFGATVLERKRAGMLAARGRKQQADCSDWCFICSIFKSEKIAFSELKLANHSAPQYSWPKQEACSSLHS